MKLPLTTEDKIKNPLKGFGFAFIDAEDNKLKIKKHDGIIEFSNTLDDVQLLDLVDCTAFEVFAHDYDIQVGECEELGGYVNNTIQASTEQRFQIRSTTLVDSVSDVIIDWGDGKSSTISKGEYISRADQTEDKEVTYTVGHTYEQNGKYIVKIFGKDYFSFRSVHISTGVVIEENDPALKYNLVSRVMDVDLPIASHVTNLANAFGVSPRLLNVHIPSYAKTDSFKNLGGVFRFCTNLLTATNFKRQFQYAENVEMFFFGCSSMTTCDFTLPAILSRGKMRSIFWGCKSLKMKVANIFLEGDVFQGGNMDVLRLFYGCSDQLDLTGCDKYLWNNKKVTYVNTPYVFRECPDSIRSQVPVLWGGTASNDIIEKSSEERIAELETRLAALESK